jgi:hypothetical protein
LHCINGSRDQEDEEDCQKKNQSIEISYCSLFLRTTPTAAVTSRTAD